jgi:hypothetical protein
MVFVFSHSISLRENMAKNPLVCSLFGLFTNFLRQRGAFLRRRYFVQTISSGDCCGTSERSHMSTTVIVILAVIVIYLATCVRQFRKLSKED